MMVAKLAAVLLLIPAVAFADMPNGGPPKPGAWQARMEKRLRTLRAIGLAEALNLDAPTALRLDAEMARFDAQRKPLHQQLHQAAQIIRRAARGDADAQSQVDQAIDQAFQARAQLQQIDRKMFEKVSSGMNPQEKAKLAVFLVRFKHQMMRQFARRRMRMRMRHGWHGRHGQAGPGAR